MRNVLIVDDFMNTRKVIESMFLSVSSLKTKRYQLIEAKNGNEALEKFNNQRIHLVITDLNMPEMDGIQLTQTIRNSKDYCRIPIILLTNEKDPKKIINAYDAGVTAVIKKPFNLDEFATLIEKVLH